MEKFTEVTGVAAPLPMINIAFLRKARTSYLTTLAKCSSRKPKNGAMSSGH